MTEDNLFHQRPPASSSAGQRVVDRIRAILGAAHDEPVIDALQRHLADLAQAQAACQALVDAYAAGAETDHVEWEAIDHAHQLAQVALGLTEEQRLQNAALDAAHCLGMEVP